jgi:hypothetical protein
MSRYNLERLGWANFEQLVRVLLREILGPGLSAFSGSADQGRDALFNGTASAFPSESEQWTGHWIIQTKFRSWGTRGVAQVRDELRSTLNDELKRLITKWFSSELVA